MSCVQPREIQIPHTMDFMLTDCGKCLNCLIKKQSALTFLANRELITKYQNNQGAAFVTLTYSDQYLPKNEYGLVTLRRSDVQKFIKNMRRQMDYYNCKKDFKIIYCGEYGDGSHSTSLTGVSTCRPHYHIVFIGLSDSEVLKYTRKLWKFGICDVGPLGQGGIRYICKYMTKASPSKEVKEFRETFKVQNPFIYHSCGLGKEWILRNLQKIADDGFTFNLNGKRYLFPKYIMRFVSCHTGISYIPYVREMIIKKVREAPKGIEFSQYDYDKSYLKYKAMCYALRSQNKPIDMIKEKSGYFRVISKHDRSYVSQLVNDALSVQKIS